jgi:hypothetical protein
VHIFQLLGETIHDLPALTGKSRRLGKWSSVADRED